MDEEEGRREKSDKAHLCDGLGDRREEVWRRFELGLERERRGMRLVEERDGWIWREF